MIINYKYNKCVNKSSNRFWFINSFVVILSAGI